MQGGPRDGFSIELSLDSCEPSEENTKFIFLAQQMYFAEEALGGEVRLITGHILNGQLIEIGRR